MQSQVVLGSCRAWRALRIVHVPAGRPDVEVPGTDLFVGEGPSDLFVGLLPHTIPDCATSPRTPRSFEPRHLFRKDRAAQPHGGRVSAQRANLRPAAKQPPPGSQAESPDQAEDDCRSVRTAYAPCARRCCSHHPIGSVAGRHVVLHVLALGPPAALGVDYATDCQISSQAVPICARARPSWP